MARKTASPKAGNSRAAPAPAHSQAPQKGVRTPKAASKRAYSVSGTRAGLWGGVAGNAFVQAASDHPQLPRLPSPTPISLTAYNARLRNMSRYQRMNDAWIRGLTDRVVERIVDTGPVPVWGDPVLEALWARVAPMLDSRGTHDWPALLSELVLGWVTDGEGFAEGLTPAEDGFDDDGYPTFDECLIPLQIRTMPPEYCPEWQTGFGGDGSPQAGYCVQGVVLDRANPDKRIGYWLYEQFPFTTGQLGVEGLLARQVPASQVAHLFKPGMAGAYRGENRLMPILIRSLRLSDYEDAVVRRKQLDCNTSITVTQDAATAGDAVMPGEYDAVTGGEIGDEGGVDYDSILSRYDSTPGALNILPAGMKINVNDPQGTPSGEDWWSKHQLMSFGACFGLPLHEVAPDIADLSDRAMKFAQTKTRASIGKDRGIVEHQVCRKVARWFVKAAFLSGRWKPAAGRRLDDYFSPTWKWPVIRDSLMAQDLSALLEAYKARAVDRDWITESFLGLDPVAVARSLAETAARDRLAGFGSEADVLVPAGTAVVADWDASTPYAQRVLEDVAAGLGTEAKIAPVVPPPANPMPIAAPADPNPDPKGPPEAA